MNGLFWLGVNTHQVLGGHLGKECSTLRGFPSPILSLYLPQFAHISIDSIQSPNYTKDYLFLRDLTDWEVGELQSLLLLLKSISFFANLSLNFGLFNFVLL